MNVQATIPAAADLDAIKSRQQVAWGSGDYAVIGTTLQIVGESLCEAVDLRSNQTVLDVAAGNGNATLAAARRFADVVSTDYVGALLERGRQRAQADRLPVTFQEADAEALPFPDASFDVVISNGVIDLIPDKEAVFAEIFRVLTPGGRIQIADVTIQNPVSAEGRRNIDLWTG
jgi:ubiquinone/menaquinone biosynthesis C-methylase UbiE